MWPKGSVEECRYFLILASDLAYGDTSELSALLDEISRMLNAYAAAILSSGSWRLSSISRRDAPGLVAGAVQINARVPIGATEGKVVLHVSDAVSQEGVTIALR